MRNLTVIGLAALIGMALHAQETSMKKTKTLAGTARKAERPAGAPEYADVCFRYGWIRKDGPASVENVKKAMRAFHATRVDWFYPGSHTMQPGATYVTPAAKAFIDWCHSKNMKVCGTINNNTMKKEWGYRKHHLTRYVGEVKNPEFVKMAVAWGKAQIDAGVDTIVCDDIFKYDAARKKLWSEKVLAVIKAHKEGFTIAGNNGGSISTDYVKQYAVDFHYSDNNFVPKPGEMWNASKAHRAMKSAFLLHPNRHIAKDTRRKMIGLGYAAGAHVITPWDEYIHGKKRLFAKPSDFADLYGFARALGQRGHLNGYEDAAVGGYDLKETRYGASDPITVSGGSGKMSVFGRAKPGKADAPVVLHLVDFGKPASCEIRIRRAVLFPSRDLSVSLLTPPLHDATIHQKAAESNDYSSLSRKKTLPKKTDGDWIVIGIPAVRPWGAVILERE